jgi:nicotinic acid mononucleotide adenylyltransferase
MSSLLNTVTVVLTLIATIISRCECDTCSFAPSACNTHLSAPSSPKQQQDRRYAVLVGTGSYNPPHKSHVQIFRLAKEQLEKDGKTVVIAAFMSPCYDGYIKNKVLSEGTKAANILEKNFANSTERLAMCQCDIEASNNQDWLRPDTWKSNRSSPAIFPEVIAHFQKRFRQKFQIK